MRVDTFTRMQVFTRHFPTSYLLQSTLNEHFSWSAYDLPCQSQASCVKEVLFLCQESVEHALILIQPTEGPALTQCSLRNCSRVPFKISTIGAFQPLRYSSFRLRLSLYATRHRPRGVKALQSLIEMQEYSVVSVGFRITSYHLISVTFTRPFQIDSINVAFVQLGVLRALANELH